jgi:hypothetical protein
MEIARHVTSFAIVLLVAVAPFNISTVAARHERQKCTPLYSLTFPPQKHCVILSHPTGKALKANRENIKYNAKQDFLAGKAAGERNSQGIGFKSWSCQSGKSKDYCRGWRFRCTILSIIAIYHIVLY